MKTNAPSILVLISAAVFCALAGMRAVEPPPDGGYPNRNTAEGEDALFHLTGGAGNVAFGYEALFNDLAGFTNTAIGIQALFNNTQGIANVATGAFALYNNTSGSNNTAVGTNALNDNTVGKYNTAIGYSAMTANTIGINNTATGMWTLVHNNTGNNNTATGFEALLNNVGGRDNTAIGVDALFNNENGNNNIAVGLHAGSNLTDGDFNIDIGNDGVTDESRTIRIGEQGTQTRAFIAGISMTGVSGTAVKIGTDGQLGVAPSSARFKDEIKPMDKASEAILALKPVTFRYKREIDAQRTPQFGLVAEDVARVNPDLVVRDNDGKPYTVRYDQVNAMLLNEFLKEHQKVQRLEAALASMDERLKKQDARIERVNDKLELSKSAPQTALNNH